MHASLPVLRRVLVLLAVAICGLPARAIAQTESETNTVRHLPDLLVTAPSAAIRDLPVPAGAALNATVMRPAPSTRLLAQDGAALLADAPGAAVVRNGPQTGIVQLRGLSGDRVRVLVDGRTLSPACPNHMDPPFHYASPAAVDTVQVLAGIAPVSLGGDSIGGTVLVQPPAPRFATNETAVARGALGASYHRANDGFGVQAEASLASQTQSVAYAGAWQTADDRRVPGGGRLRASGYDTQQHGASLAGRTENGLWSVDSGLVRTRDAGTPALPMDMIEDDSLGLGLKQAADYDWGRADLRAYVHTIDHHMDNYSLRPVAPGMPRMESPAESDDGGLRLNTAWPAGTSTLRVGAEAHRNAFDAYQRNIATGARQDTLNQASRTRAGAYVERETHGRTPWSTVLGLRGDAVMSDADAIEDSFPSAAPDAARFNAGDRETTETAIDASATLRYDAAAAGRYEVGVARQNRAPSLLERYLWTPLSASAGQADGRTYLGRLDLEPETAHQIAAAADWRGPRWQARISPFYKIVDNYIQGAPTERLDAMQRPVLQYSNLDRADLYGVDGQARLALTDHVGLDATAGYVRGRNRDDDDNLYRIAPLHGTVALEHRRGGWDQRAQLALAQRQDDVARYNAEPATAGFAVLNLSVGHAWPNACTARLGVDNVFDKRYADHLGGINRVGDSDVGVGERIPEAGRSLVAALHGEF
ncbi:MAG: TonB-dependent receptor [Lentisphaerae bacterium]|nr:TonB-dependent receptor [Lentisphaerota bacterium]